MFEDSTFDSTGKAATRSRRWMLVAFAINGSILATLILIPWIDPEALPRKDVSILVTAPSAPTSTAPRAALALQPAHATLAAAINPLQAPRRIPVSIDQTAGNEPPATVGDLPDGMGTGSIRSPGLPGGLPGNSMPRPDVTLAPPKKITVSSGVAEGLAISRTQPVYPQLARSMRLSGTVVLHAIISATGTIQNLDVVSGPPMLGRAAIDAVKTWRYRPFLLNGVPVAVETEIRVNFTLGG